jgi:uncharacterized LabA/DUF88 family protein
MTPNKKKSVAVIDGPNNFHCAKFLDFKIDSRKLLAFINSRWDCRQVHYYSPATERTEAMLKAFGQNGYDIVSREQHIIKGDDGSERTINPNLLVDMICDTFDELYADEDIEHVVIFGGNGEMLRFVQSLNAMNIGVTIVSSVGRVLSRKLETYISSTGGRNSLIDLRTLRDQLELGNGGLSLVSDYNKSSDQGHCHPVQP